MQTKEWINRMPTLIYSFFAGSLSDDFGRKPLIVMPMLGALIGGVITIINYTFIHTLPIEFFYLADCWYYYFGGSSIYYLGIYSFGSSVTTPANRVKVLARYDAMELIGYVVGKNI